MKRCTPSVPIYKHPFIRGKWCLYIGTEGVHDCCFTNHACIDYLKFCLRVLKGIKFMLKTLKIKKEGKRKVFHTNQVDWAPVARSSFQGCIQGILGSIPRENNVRSVCMSLRTSWINRPSLMDRKRCERKRKKKKESLPHNMRVHFFLLD